MKLEATIQKNGTILQAELYRSVFTAYPGFSPPEDDILTPELVYQTTRPGDWLPMPTPADDEMYLLGLVYPIINGIFSARITHSGNCTVEFGSLENDVFVPRKRINPTSAVRFTESLLFSDYDDPIFDGAHQYFVRIKGNVSEIELLKESDNAMPNNIVDIICGMEVYLVCGTTSAPNKCLQSLRYLNYVGNGRPTAVSGCFAWLKSLMSVRCDAPPRHYQAYYVFTYNTSLRAVSPNFLGTGNRSVGMSFPNTGLTNLHMLGYATDIDGAFTGSALSVFSTQTINTQYAKNMSRAFYDCYVLRQVTGLDITSATNVTNMFKYCFNLSRLLFAGETTTGGWTIDLTTTALNHNALVEMIASLPTATAAATITITGLPGASELTDAEIAVATAKNWTITR